MPAVAIESDAEPSDPPPAAGAERPAARADRERPAVAQLLRLCADGIARKTYALEQLADRTRGPSQATVYKALQALEKERAIFSDLAERVDTVDDGNWDSFKREALRAVDTVREPDDDDRPDPSTPPPARKIRPADSAAAAKR